MGNETNDPGAAAHQIIVLAFDLVDSEIERIPNQIATAMNSPAVKAAIEKSLLDFAKTRTDPNKTQVSDAEAKKLFEALGKGVKDAGGDALLEQIKKTPEYQKLQGSIENFKKAAESSSLGVWVDKNKGILYVIGAALVVGTSSVLYITKTGGTVVNTAVSPLQGKEFDVVKIGALKLQAALWEFKPDAQILGAKVLATVTLQKVTINLKLGVLAQGAEVQKVEGAAVVKSGPIQFTATTEAKPQTNVVNLGLKLDYTGAAGNGKFNIGIGAMYQDNLASGQLNAGYQTKSGVNFGLSGNVGQQKSGGPAYGGLFTVTIPL